MFNPERPPEISAQRWINSDKKRSLKSEKGKVIVVAIWQLTCPGSQKYGLKFAEQSPEKVEAFLAENDITIPVALDKPDDENLPETMRAYELQGTPAMLIFDRQGRLRRHYLGAVDDLRIGAEVMALLIEDKESPREMSIAIESKLAAALVDPEAHSHDHEHGDACGCGHDHSHDRDHHHDHEHGEPGHVHGPDCKHLMAEKPDKEASNRLRPRPVAGHAGAVAGLRAQPQGAAACS